MYESNNWTAKLSDRHKLNFLFAKRLMNSKELNGKLHITIGF